ncbi:sigma factor-like helix-turn-helix DNA-binding protein [Streptomyces sp. NPDC048251]|uniref:sigma factor-like helix-turn-helix DNA-binding protein n=1 Tax=Streptomyces sp. NPDC048251 TaxID=3154501 RepID=UPI003412FB85
MREWLVRMWGTGVLDERERFVVASGAEGQTLDNIGENLGLGRERARQIRDHARQKLANVADIVLDGWRDVVRVVGSGPGAPRLAFAARLGVEDSPALEPLLAAAGLVQLRTWAGPVQGWWGTEPHVLSVRLDQLVDTAPFRGDGLDRAAAAAGLPAELPLTRILSHPQSRLALSADGHWVRRKARGRDAAYLRLLEIGHPCRPEDLLAPMASTTVAAVREALRRDDRFRQIRPEGTWALTEWTHLSVGAYANAVEAMIAVVTEHGPLPKNLLFSRVIELYPVSPSRLRQCLLSDQLGRTPDGLIDLVARGALTIEEDEPTKPATMVIEGDVLGARITVDKEVLRGSGVVVHPWLTWRLGLRQAPASRTFTVPGTHPPLTVRRATSAAQLSSLRCHAEDLGAAEGCFLVVLLRLDDGTARVMHGCAGRGDACSGKEGGR